MRGEPSEVRPRLDAARVALRLSAIVGALLFGGWAAGGCAEGRVCETNSDCPSAYCSNGKCMRDCKADIDCPQGFECSAIAQCVTEGSGGAPATGGTGGVDAGTGGSGGGAGSGGTAGMAGAAATGGASGMAGMAGTSGTGGAAGAAGVGGSSGMGGMGGQSGGTGRGGTGGMGGGGTRTEFQPCIGNNQCASPLICRETFKGSGASMCTRRCSNTDDCMQSTRCEQFGAEQYCVFNDIGRVCQQADQCQFACFMQLGQTDGYCTSECVDGRDCPAGYGCQGIGTPPVRACVWATAPCDANPDLCVVPAACDTSMLVSSCTLACNTPLDCPQRSVELVPWTCDGICRRPGDVRGPLPGGVTAEWACDGTNVVHICGDGLHFDFNQGIAPPAPPLTCPTSISVPGLPGDTCVDSCLLESGCSFGSMCTGTFTTTGSNRLGVCLPGFGTGVLGTPCTSNDQCFFGYCANGRCSRDCTLDGICINGTSCVNAGGPLVEGRPFRRCE